MHRSRRLPAAVCVALVALAPALARAYVLVRTIESPSLDGDYFGISLAALGDDVLIGAPFNHTGAGPIGTVDRFTLATGAFVQSYPTTRPGVLDAFGWSVAAL